MYQLIHFYSFSNFLPSCSTSYITCSYVYPLAYSPDRYSATIFSYMFNIESICIFYDSNNLVTRSESSMLESDDFHAAN